MHQEVETVLQLHFLGLDRDNSIGPHQYFIFDMFKISKIGFEWIVQLRGEGESEREACAMWTQVEVSRRDVARCPQWSQGPIS